MLVTVFAGSSLIGTALLDQLDPPMGVAGGRFMPTANYDPHCHANVIEGEFDLSRGQSLSVHADDAGLLDTHRVDIEDWTTTAGEKLLYVAFCDGRVFEKLFSSYDDYRSYFRRASD